jgi:hypothetical protein
MSWRAIGMPPDGQQSERNVPVVTICVLAIAAIVTGLQLIGRQYWLQSARRERLQPGSGGVYHTIVRSRRGSAPDSVQFFAVVGTFVERIFSRRDWLLLYFVSGVFGELAGMFWKPTGAGASVAGCGLLGALAVWVLARKTGEDVLQAHSSCWGPPFWFSFATFMVRPSSRAPYSLLCF